MTIRKFTVLCTAAILTLTTELAGHFAWAGPVDEGIAFYKQKQYSQALAKIAVPAREGDATAQYYLGLMHATGNGAAKSDTRAVDWFKKSSAGGNAQAATYLGYMYERSLGVPKDIAKAVELYRLGGARGDSSGNNNMAKLHEKGLGVPQSYSLAKHYYELAYSQGRAGAATDLGFLYDKGKGSIPQDDVKAVEWYRKGAEGGNMHGMGNLGYMYYNGRGAAQSYDQALFWIRKGAEKGHQNSEYRMGEIYELGRGVSVNKTEALRWYQKAADQGMEAAKKKAASLAGSAAVEAAPKPASTEGNFKNFTCIPSDKSGCIDGYEDAKSNSKENPLTWAMMGCKNNVVGLCYNAAIINAKGLYGNPVVQGAALIYYNKACDKGHKDACFNAANFHSRGQGGRVDLTKALELYEKGCGLGDAEACGWRDITKQKIK